MLTNLKRFTHNIIALIHHIKKTKHIKTIANIKRFTHNIMTLIYHIKKLLHIKRFTHNIMTLIISSHLSPLTSEVVGAPQMRLQQYLSTFPVFHCPQEISKPHSRPFLDVIFPSLLLSSSPSCSFHCPLQKCLRYARGS